MKFNEFDFTQEVLDGLDAMRFEQATPVQEMAIPVIKNGTDLIACAQTGTGKTAAYLLPILDRIVRERNTGTTALILVPTRELALQIDQQVEGFSYFLNVTSVSVFGGNDKGLWDQQKNGLTKGADIIVATPGRMIQHLTMGYVDFAKVKYLILDEADRMLDMGFHEDIMMIESYLPKTARQGLLFSATMPPKIRELAKNLLNKPHEINIAISKPAEGILQAAYLVHEYQKIDLTVELLRDKDLPSILVFSSRKSKVNDIVKALRKNKFNARGIHSDLDQSERIEVLREFKNRNVQILVATDIVARGIDIEKIDLVINFDVPNDAEDYVHRIGRTARAQTQGVGITFITEDKQYDFSKIEELIQTEIYKVPLPAHFDDAPKYDPKGKRGKVGSRKKGGGKGKGDKKPKYKKGGGKRK
ncbi:Superfamily II DNA and RNA helicase [Saccharicrinis carchari]|uniref:Superfamily II DNA and RNA helicase n=1 Tax=Saccharicrinis carchari TaxID=1168039 RepID=A0A521C3X7_SACCC|nr:DEAD/DEAH box helicase [Saccharicrinis carchari]SMO54045.1 Superfamily II DNA and RNA helicase [Saccharicrinis carchari]